MFSYVITNNQNGKQYVSYTDKSENIDKLLLMHSHNEIPTPKILLADFLKYGLDLFSINQITRVPNEQSAKENVAKFIREWETDIDGYNIEDEQPYTPKVPIKINPYAKDEEWKKNLSAKCKTKRQVLCIETNEVYESITDASKHLGLPITHISRICRGIGKSCKGYHFKFVSVGGEQSK